MRRPSGKPARFLAGLVFGCFASIGRAEDIYLAQSARGRGDGTSAADAKSVSFFNAARNWESPVKRAKKIGPGDTVHLVGKITTQLAVQASGSAGHPITLLFERDAALTSPAWPSDGAINVGRHEYITIDGGINGLIENSANGDFLDHQVNSIGVYASGASNFTVQNLTVANIYVRESGETRNAYGQCISNRCIDADSVVNYRVTHCVLHDAFIGINSEYGAGCSGYEFSFNQVYRCNWSGKCSDRHAGATMTGLSVHDNAFSDWKNWDETRTNDFHHDGFYAWAESGGKFYAASFYNNLIGPNYNGDPRVNHCTAGIYCSGRGMIGPILIYNNVFVENPQDSPADGSIYLLAGDGAHVGVYNNTFAGGGRGMAINISGMEGGIQRIDIENNLCIAKTFIDVFEHAPIELTSDYNDGYALLSDRTFSISNTDSSHFLSFAQWRALGYDRHSVSADPKLNDGYVPQPPSGAIGVGTDLSAYFTTDKAGRPRPRAAAWSLGAYEAGQNSLKTGPQTAE